MGKQLEAPPAASEAERFRLLIEGISDYAIYMLDPDGVVVSWNTGAQRFKGYQASEIIGRHFSLFYPEEDRRDGLPARALHLAATEGKYEQEGWRIRKDGSRMWAHVVIDPIRDRDGKLLGFGKITRDLTERRQAREALRQSEEQFRLLIQSVTDYAIYMLTPQGNVSSWNLGAERIKGYKPDEIIGRHFSQFYSRQDRAAGVPELALAAAAREGRFESEGWRIRKDGTSFWASVVIDPIKDEAGHIIGFAKVTRDITERRAAQRELEKTREAFFQAQKSEALGQLTGGVAHDFNNLLMVILSSLELASKRLPDDPKLRRLIGSAVQGAQRGASLTQHMLAFARRQELKIAPVAMGELVAGMLDMLERSLGPSISIRTDVPLSMPPAMADANQLELAILNLAVNARDAMPNGGTIAITARHQRIAAPPKAGLNAGSYVCITIADTGEGMDAATLSRATEPFFTTKGVGKGTGLGLSMVHGMAEQLGGAMLIRSTQGAGTSIEIWLPAGTHYAEAADYPLAASSLDTPRQAAIILAVDDDSLVLGNVREMLEDLGYQTLMASSGKEAMKVFHAAPRIDLILTDQAMPNMTGIELVTRLRADQPNLRAVLASGYADLTEGVDASIYRLSKPFLQSTLADVIATALRS